MDTDDHEYLRAVLLDQVEHVARRLRCQGLRARTITLKIRSADFTTITRSQSFGESTDLTDVLWEAASRLFETWRRQRPPATRLIGVGVSQLAAHAGQQNSLFDQEEINTRRQLDRTVDKIRDKFGDDAISRGGSSHDGLPLQENKKRPG